MKLKKYILSLITIHIVILNVQSQDDISSLVDAELSSNATDYASGTFFTTRILNAHSVQLMPKGGLDFRIHHRFDKISEGYNRFWGIDGSLSLLTLEYGFAKKFMAGIGRENDAMYYAYAKYELAHQCSGQKNFPITIVWLTSSGIDGFNYKNDPEKNKLFAQRFSYVNQLLIARMFSYKLSLQLSPTWIHRNMTQYKEMKNDLFAIGVGGRYKITNTFSINFEYYKTIGNEDISERNISFFDPISLGIDIQVSGHVFQIMITNASKMIESSFLTDTREDFFSKGIRIGFNISQVFTIKK